MGNLIGRLLCRFGWHKCGVVHVLPLEDGWRKFDWLGVEYEFQCSGTCSRCQQKVVWHEH